MAIAAPFPGGMAAHQQIDEFFEAPKRFPAIVGMKLDGATDWNEVAGLVCASYCVMAPTKLVERLGQSRA